MLLHLKHTDTETGKAYGTWHSVWDAELFVTSVQKQYSNPKKPQPIVVTVISEDEYRQLRKGSQ